MADSRETEGLKPIDKKILVVLDETGVKFTTSVPFERLAELKAIIDHRRRWRMIDREWSYFETSWKPKSWDCPYRFIFVRRKVKNQSMDPIQLDLFEPRHFSYQYKVIVTNKSGSQEALFGSAKNEVGLDVIATRRLAANQTFTLCAMMAHNLSRELQMLAAPAALRARPKRPTAWKFHTLDTLRHRFIQRAGRLTRPQGTLTLIMSANPSVRKDLLHFLDAVTKAAA